MVITVVVLLILAGVAISITLDPDGLFTQAEKAKADWNAKVTEEQTEIDKVLGYLGIDPTTQISDEIPQGKGWDDTKVDKVAVQGSRMAPIPVGHTVSEIAGENSINGGLVVYQIPEGAEVDWENNQITLSGATEPVNLQETVNQYVWIPVDNINQMIMCKKNNERGTVEELYEDDLCNIDLVENVLKCTKHDSTDLCGRLYVSTSETEDETYPKTYKTNMNFADRAQKFDIEKYYEPREQIGNIYETEEEYEQRKYNFMEMATSVKKYGGFYVGKYEAGENGVSKKNQRVITTHDSDINENVKGVKDWFGLYDEVYCDITKENEEEVTILKSQMIFGCQFDQIVNFIGSKAQVGQTGIRATGQTKTGLNDKDIFKNIHDLYGNNREWTQEAYNSGGGYFVFRGNMYGDDNYSRVTYTPISSRINDHYDDPWDDIYLTTRAALHILP